MSMTILVLLPRLPYRFVMRHSAVQLELVKCKCLSVCVRVFLTESRMCLSSPRPREAEIAEPATQLWRRQRMGIHTESFCAVM